MHAVGLSNIIVGLSGSGYTGSYIFSQTIFSMQPDLCNAAAAAPFFSAVGLSNIIVGLLGSGYTGSLHFDLCHNAAAPAAAAAAS
jgi:hypothetical protein